MNLFLVVTIAEIGEVASYATGLAAAGGTGVRAYAGRAAGSWQPGEEGSRCGATSPARSSKSSSESSDREDTKLQFKL